MLVIKHPFLPHEKLALRRGSSEPSFLGLNVDMIRNGYLPKAVDADVLAGDSRSLEEQMASVGLYDIHLSPT